MAPATYRFKNKYTDVYIISTDQDTDGQIVVTKNGTNSVPNDSVRAHLSALAFTAHRPFPSYQILNVNPAISGSVTVATITGASGLYIALQVGLHPC